MISACVELKPENLAEGNTGVKTTEEGRVK
jgi:hypothetical protein